ncbi:MAG: ribonucleoside-diphosphate reductase, adenosylcobalamin-dependent [Deltaproteobacteria bacterium RBG_16_49_23]|nr:MAG: ribonucleoside-diphosphate reductase, adenosylcobalamin-dependent [Deltaproteobacteria bacterium RBG_16_49_23]
MEVIHLTQNAITVLEKRYLMKDLYGNIVETPEDLFRRVAGNIAQADRLYDPSADLASIEEAFYDMMASLDFLPNSPTLMNAGRELQQLSACFVLPVGDSMEEIFDAVKQMALIQKSGGGTGFAFSRLRPKNDVVGSTKGVSSGPVSFMSVFDNATEAIKQGGTRRGANMGILRVDHPDILDFIKCKDEDHRFTNFNISVAATNEFMEAVEKGETFPLRNPRTKETLRLLDAKEVFEKMVYYAWKNGDPGIIFIDRINQDNPTPQIGPIESTNPCGEQPLLPYESCNLGSINLSHMVKNGEVDWQKLASVTERAVHFLDNVIDMNRYTLPQIEAMTKANRKIGLGVMGFADLLIQLGIPYDHPKAFEIGEKAMAFIQERGRKASRELTLKRGSFPNFDASALKDQWDAMRNATVTTIAPTGTISIIAGTSSGIEPLFALAFVRHVLDGKELLEINPFFEAIAKEEGFHSEELTKKIAQLGHIVDLEEVPERVRHLFVTAHDISPEDHIRMQAAFQKYTDNAVSKTVNFSHEAAVDDVAKVYELAYQLGCKGVTIYRDRSREMQVLYKGLGASEEDRTGAREDLSKMERKPRARRDVIHGSTWKIRTGCGNIYVTVNEDEDGRLFEIFNQIGKAGGCAASQSEALGRLVSLAFRSNIEPEDIIRQLKGISCHMPVWHQNGKVLSCSDAVAKAIEWHNQKMRAQRGGVIEKEVPTNPPEVGTARNRERKNSPQGMDSVFLRGACPECGGPLIFEEGCVKCFCGYSDCG